MKGQLCLEALDEGRAVAAPGRRQRDAKVMRSPPLGWGGSTVAALFAWRGGAATTVLDAWMGRSSDGEAGGDEGRRRSSHLSRRRGSGTGERRPESGGGELSPGGKRRDRV
jgi:hypothetical protein